jgi:hypothetical protein
LHWGELLPESCRAEHLQGLAHHRNDLRWPLIDHGAGEAQHTPAVQDEQILTPTVDLKDLRVGVAKAGVKVSLRGPMLTVGQIFLPPKITLQAASHRWLTVKRSLSPMSEV